ncbi:hypothetical protein [Candidatus Poriferisodalis sp.]|uniref:hypothetical protein n=1 Tax=Candidatus Poriferisodalis sp. TaxID=3101277 RepID=UPI003C6EC6BE
MPEGYLADESERRRVSIGGKPRRPCGTWAAAQWHSEHGESLCESCAEASKRWGRFVRARNKLKRQRAAGASAAELGELNAAKLRLELEYRSLERLTDTPVPPSHRWEVYRFKFETGESYVGITERSVAAREAEHISGGERLTGGSAKISELVAAGVDYELETIAHGLTEGKARALESKEISMQERPLNVHGRVQRWTE